MSSGDASEVITANGTAQDESEASHTTEQVQGETSSQDAQATTKTARSFPAKKPICIPVAQGTAATEVLQRIAALRQRPLFTLVAEKIDDNVLEAVYGWRKQLKAVGKADNLDVLIHSPGGDLDSCYRIARLLALYTNDWQALVPDLAASGATLICLGSSSIVMSDIAFLGPMDPQVLSRRPSKFFVIERQSPLEAFQATKYLRQYSLEMLHASMYYLLVEQAVAPQMAIDTASKLSIELSRPILEKIEPYDLGAFALDSNLAKNYCERICKPDDAPKKTQREADYEVLVEDYPAHEFTIDRQEARSLGLEVCEPSEDLEDLFDELRPMLRRLNFYVGLVPVEEGTKP